MGSPEGEERVDGGKAAVRCRHETQGLCYSDQIALLFIPNYQCDTFIIYSL